MWMPFKLISEVRRRPLIWNTSSEEYKNKHKKKEAWVEVCSSLIEEFHTKPESEQKLIIQDITSKWRTVRDNYIRNLKKLSDSGSKKVKPYLYSQQLSFLKKNKDLQTFGGSLEENSNELDNGIEYEDDPLAGTYDVNYELATSSSINTGAKRRCKSPDVARSFTDYADDHKAARNPIPEDEDLAFFYSLLPSVRSLNADEKFTFRIQTMQQLQNLKNQKTRMSLN